MCLMRAERGMRGSLTSYPRTRKWDPSLDMSLYNVSGSRARESASETGEYGIKEWMKRTNE